MTQNEKLPEADEPYEPSTHEDSEPTTDEAPNPETGVGLGMMDEPTSFEPEEDPEAASTGDPSTSS